MKPTGDHCVGFFEEAWHAGVLPLRRGASVLEIGSAEFNWLAAFHEERPDVQLTGIDVRPQDGAIQADVLTYDLPLESFDAVVSISTLEHIGLGSYSDPVDPEGDTKAIQRAWGWLKPGGWLYFDVPYRPEGDYVVTGNYRAYNPTAFQARLSLPNVKERWRRVFGALGEGDAPYVAVVWEKAA